MKFFYIRLAVFVECCECGQKDTGSADFECPSDPSCITLPEGWEWYQKDYYDERNPRCLGCVERGKAEAAEAEQKAAEVKAKRAAKRAAKKAKLNDT